LTDAAKKEKIALSAIIVETLSSNQRGTYMSKTEITNLDRAMAKVCESCPVCRLARRNQQGLANRFVRGIEVNICPFCRAYGRVRGRKAHEPLGEKGQ
jgi:hypothetical protein